MQTVNMKRSTGFQEAGRSSGADNFAGESYKRHKELGCASIIAPPKCLSGAMPS